LSLRESSLSGIRAYSVPTLTGIAYSLQIVKDTNSIVCNAAELKFASATFSEKDGKYVSPALSTIADT
jgi:hypothetical protein